uniref:Uncharacterized protein n=1 Tax=Brassica oleracea TaxID=3712 RepID=A0A3P6FIX4_BRAOL|nr:unnamed protein product [Brassica oleracea]
MLKSLLILHQRSSSLRRLSHRSSMSLFHRSPSLAASLSPPDSPPRKLDRRHEQLCFRSSYSKRVLHYCSSHKWILLCYNGLCSARYRENNECC